MSTYTHHRVYCDEPGCQEVYSRSTNGAGLSLAWVLNRAAHDGWAVSQGGKVTRCPNHRRPLKTHAYLAEGRVGCKAVVNGTTCWKPADHAIHRVEKEGR